MNKPFNFPLLILALTVCSGLSARADVLFSDDFDSFTPVDNPWACVDGSGLIKGLVGSQLVIDDVGNTDLHPSSPSVAVGDLNGDGLPDLILADSAGFFWYFENHGTKTAPKFTTPEVMPIWVGEPCPDIWHQGDIVSHNTVPRIQLIDFDGDGRLDLVIGNFLGQLFYFRNLGSPQEPVFKSPANADDVAIPTQEGGRLWCNYLAPWLADWHKNGHLDMVIGDGSYSANSIFFLGNKGSNDHPLFKSTTFSKIIPGMGREHLEPEVVPWNGDGKPDILSVEREGYLNLFLNTGFDNQGFPTYDKGQHISVGGQDKLDPLSTVTLASLTGGLPGLVIGTQDGHVSYAPNTGKPNAYQFGTPVPLTGVNPLPQILAPGGWKLDGGYGEPYSLLVVTNAKVEPGFTPPENSGVTNALKCYIDKPAAPNPTFPSDFYPSPYDLRSIIPPVQITMNAGTRYKMTCWMKATGQISTLGYRADGFQTGPVDVQMHTDGMAVPGSDWTQISEILEYTSKVADPHAPATFDFSVNITGTGTLYIAQFKISTD